MDSERDSLLAESCCCGQCQLDLSHLAFAQRVAHIKKCSGKADATGQQDDLSAQLQDSLLFGRAFTGTSSPAIPASASGRPPLLPLKAPTHSVRDWLEAFNMGGFADAFEKEEVDMRALPLLSDDDLIYLGVTSKSQRKTLLTAARELTQQTAVPLNQQASTSHPCLCAPASQGRQSETKSMTGVTLPPLQGVHGREHDQNSHRNDSQKGRPLEYSKKRPINQSAPSCAQPLKKAQQKRQDASSAVHGARMPKAARRGSAASKQAEPQWTTSMNVQQLGDSIVPDSEEDSDFADDRPVPRLMPATKKAKPSAEQKTRSEAAPCQSRTGFTGPASAEEEREQLERALALSLSAQRELGSNGSQPSARSSSVAADAVQQHTRSVQLPGYLSGALGRVLAARNSRGRVSQNRSYSRQTEQRLLDALYPPGTCTRTDSCSSSLEEAALPRADGKDCMAADQSGWSSDEDVGQEKTRGNSRADDFRLHGLLSRSSIGERGKVQRVPPERSLWAMAQQSGAAACSASLQERFAARKVADLEQQAALAASKAECRTRDARSTDPCNGCEREGASKSSAAVDGTHAKSACCTVTEEQQNCLQKPAAGRRDVVAGQAAMRVEALREELVAAEATVVELKRYLAEAEAELGHEQNQRK